MNHRCSLESTINFYTNFYFPGVADAINVLDLKNWQPAKGNDDHAELHGQNPSVTQIKALQLQVVIRIYSSAKLDKEVILLLII